MTWIQAVLATNFVLLAINVFTGVLTARLLGPSGKGQYNTVMLWLGVGTTLATGGLPPAFILTYRSEATDRRSTLASSLILAGAWPLVIATGMLLIVPHAVAHLGSTVTWWTELALLTLPMAGLASLLQAYLTAEYAFGWYNILRLGVSSSLVVPLCCLWFAGALTPIRLVAVALASGLASGVAVLIVSIKLMRVRRVTPKSPSRTSLRRLITLGSRFYALGLASLFNARLDQMLATVWLGARDIGLYSVASSVLSVVGIASVAFQTVFLPAVAGDARETIIRRTASGVRKGTLALLGLIALTLTVVQPVFTLLYGSRYAPAVPAVLGLLPAGISIAVLQIIYQGCYALKDTVTPTIGEIVGAVTGAALLAILVPHYGIIGAALATSSSYLLDLAVVCWLWRRRTNTSDFLPRREDLFYLTNALQERPVQALRMRFHRQVGSK